MCTNLLLIVLFILPIPCGQTTGPATKATTRPSASETIRAAVKAGLVGYQLTDPDELRQLLGTPQSESKERDGDMEVLIQHYPGVKALFRKAPGNGSPFVLFRLTAGWRTLDIGSGRTVVLRNEGDLRKFDLFWGLTNASLVRLDLRQHRTRLDQLPFDSRTVWPAADRLPDGFDPARLLEDGKNPGLGLRGLHGQGIDGRGIHIAIIDQPLLLTHQEYKDRIVAYEPIDVRGAPVQMHGPPVTSIAVGKTCGVAPAAAVHYYAVPTWKWSNLHCKPYAEVLDGIVRASREARQSDKVRVVSISLGMFSAWPDYQLWKEAVQRAAAEGILVVSCDPQFLRYGTASRIAGNDRELPSGYRRGRYSSGSDVLLVPAGERTTASHAGDGVYTFWREGGMSWAAPYLAGLAALACQVNPQIEPQNIVALWRKTAGGETRGVPVVHAARFIEAVRSEKTPKTQP